MSEQAQQSAKENVTNLQTNLNNAYGEVARLTRAIKQAEQNVASLESAVQGVKLGMEFAREVDAPQDEPNIEE